jgi:hypothetical protein
MFGRPESMKRRFQLTNVSRIRVAYELDGQTFILEPRMTREHERCGASSIALQLPGMTEPVRVTPAAGERLRVEDSGGRLRLQRG